MNEFLRNTIAVKIYGKLIKVMNIYSSDSVIVISDTILYKSEKHVWRPQQIF